ncbi:hypothetical protein LXM94_11850 [Rhizobium sp. TRM95111]|uniref:plant virulence effector HPE1-like domain-containing protein n=1 Tax=Rhizobium alarense TaxID=2846851 RepID=UPI001F439C34|nr:plant virulence effector HPE1-like domain-containing protein [Rhizobium alarense]MCF3640658.1 hypothetical protein [Rhizobium alarense]
MRATTLSLAVALLAAPALASSIEPVASGEATNSSIETIRCGDCPMPKPKPMEHSYQVDAIAPGTQKVEVREVGGERKVFRTESWMGGSPVVFVSKAVDLPTDTASAAAELEKAAETVDTAATTGALTRGAAADVTTANAGGTVPAKALDTATFELRVN